jgi:hypothetical protein
MTLSQKKSATKKTDEAMKYIAITGAIIFGLQMLSYILGYAAGLLKELL